MRRAGLAALVAALTVGTTLVATSVVTMAEGVPLPVPAPKKSATPPSAQGGPPAAMQILPDAIGNLISPPKSGDNGALDDKKRALVDKVNAYLSSVQTLVGDFVQVGPDGRRTEGQFYLQKPGRVRFAYNPPTPVDVVADGHSVVVRDRSLATQELYPL